MGFYFQSDYTECQLDMISKEKYDESMKDLFQLKSRAFTWISFTKETQTSSRKISILALVLSQEVSFELYVKYLTIFGSIYTLF